MYEEELMDKHKSVLCSFGISTNDEGLGLPSLRLIPKLHKRLHCIIIFLNLLNAPQILLLT